MSQQAQNDYYADEEALIMDYAAAVNAELKDLKAAGADVVQIDEPYLQARVEKARKYALPAIERALDGIGGPTALHTCFGYAAVIHTKPKDGYPFLAELDGAKVRQISLEAAQPGLPMSALAALPHKEIILGVIDLNDMAVESPATVAGRIRAALAVLPPERLIIAPDCGMKYLPREIAFAKLRTMVEGTKIMRAELARQR